MGSMVIKTRTKILNGLDYKEQEELKKRGFFVKDAVPFSSLFGSIIIGLVLLALLIPTAFCFSMLIVILLQNSNIENFLSYIFYIPGYIFSLPAVVYIYRRLISYTFLGSLFYSGKDMTAGKITITKIYELKLMQLILLTSKTIRGSTKGVKLGQFIIAPFLLTMLPIAGIQVLIEFEKASSIEYIKYVIVPILFLIFIGVIGSSIVRSFIEKLHPLYAFGNLGSKIQSLTPTIEEKSREIEVHFRENMNFAKLRSDFSDLSKSLAKVSEYILKLEQAEKKANKGNLFDSVKYIDSLKGDIVKPLIALRSFLSTRLTELEKSKGVLSKVRVKVGGGEEALALQSARTEPLMIELRGNIEKLDVMIEKL